VLEAVGGQRVAVRGHVVGWLTGAAQPGGGVVRREVGVMVVVPVLRRKENELKSWREQARWFLFDFLFEKNGFGDFCSDFLFYKKKADIASLGASEFGNKNAFESILNSFHNIFLSSTFSPTCGYHHLIFDCFHGNESLT
jgi:hypothetical protein